MNDYPKSGVRDGMHITWDAPIEMDDGVVLRCDVYRPPDDGEHPVLMSYGPYGKWLHFKQHRRYQWEWLCEKHPDVLSGSTGKYHSWETVDPEKWVPDGYAVVRVDSRGAGRSPGYLDVYSERETDDFAQCIEWAGEQPWSNGNVGLNGISYYAVNQWQVASREPDHLTAMCAWEGAADRYRDGAYHGGIYDPYGENWIERSVKPVQHGKGSNGYRSLMTGDWVSGPDTLTEEELDANCADIDDQRFSNELATDEYWEPRIPDFSEIDIPLLSAGNWGGHGFSLRGNVEGFVNAASTEKWLEIHGNKHWTHFYDEYGLRLQKRFFDHFLKNEQTGWEGQPQIQLQIRHPNQTFELRHEDGWPIPRTEWTRYYLHAAEQTLELTEPDTRSSVTYAPLGDGVTFLSDPFEERTEITGPIAAKLFVESETTDADLFLVVRLFGPDMAEVVFEGALDPNKPIALGWLRASHRKVDPDRSEAWRPYHTHDEKQPLQPGEIYELDVEIWPTSVVAPAGYRLGLSVRGRDYEYPGADPETTWRGYTGVGRQQHADARDRPPAVYGGDVTIHAGTDAPSHVLLPVVPSEGDSSSG